MFLIEEPGLTMTRSWVPGIITRSRTSEAHFAVANEWQRCYEQRDKAIKGDTSEETHISFETDQTNPIDRNEISGLPLVCHNCGISFFSLATTPSPGDDNKSYCSGECKWSVIMYRDMSRRMYALRGNQVPPSDPNSYEGTEEYGSTYNDLLSCS